MLFFYEVTFRRNCFPFILLMICNFLVGGSLYAQQSEDFSSTDQLKKMSIEELMNVEVEVFSVSKRPEKLTEVASAIQVISSEDIRRSAATSLPEVLRLATNLQVAQLNSYAWIVSARGFNSIFSNKLLVMIDGRTVYSPLFAGVFWDAQNILLEDIERIEIVSGPGGTLWGANAVNGVINIITKNSKDSKGLYVSVSGGDYLRKGGAVRYGGKIGSSVSYRVYAQHNERSNTFLAGGIDDDDKWELSQGGFQMDWDVSEASKVMVQGSVYKGTEYTKPASSTLDGQYILGRWIHKFSERSDLIVQTYFDRTWRRDIPSTISDQLQTYDFDFQHRFSLGKMHSLLWGGGYRFMKNHTLNSTQFVGFLPSHRDMNLFSGFIQDEIMLKQDRLKFTIGSKLQHNDFTGFEIQPNARLAWTPGAKHTVWGAVSRAVRMPSRIDVDYHIPAFILPPTLPSVAGGPNFESETVVAYELGYRVQPKPNLSLSFATFYNNYDDLYSVEALPGTLTYQIQNGNKGYSYGAEFSGTYKLAVWWSMRGGYTYFYKELESKPGHITDPSSLGNDAKHFALLQSMIDLPGNFQFDLVMRYIDRLPQPYIPDYFTFDIHLAWTYKKWLELSVSGQNLWEDQHREIAQYIPRSIYGKVTCRF